MSDINLKQNILIVEDEQNIAEFIQQGLRENNYNAEFAQDGYLGLKMAIANQYDLIILDIGLPRIDGFEICSTLRKKGILVPILMLTAYDALSDKLAGFDAGTDDYLVKPFEFSELLARIRAILNRSHKEEKSENLIMVADLVIDIFRKTVKRGHKRIDLTSKEFSLLEYFARNPGKVITREEIAKNVWNINFDTGTNLIDVYINFLRNKIDKDFDQRLLHTVVGVGYTLREENV